MGLCAHSNYDLLIIYSIMIYYKPFLLLQGAQSSTEIAAHRLGPTEMDKVKEMAKNMDIPHTLLHVHCSVLFACGPYLLLSYAIE